MRGKVIIKKKKPGRNVHESERTEEQKVKEADGEGNECECESERMRNACERWTVRGKKERERSEEQRGVDAPLSSSWLLTVAM